jgi:hypothetical protein
VGLEREGERSGETNANVEIEADERSSCELLGQAFDNKSFEARAGISYTNTGIPLEATNVNPTVP